MTGLAIACFTATLVMFTNAKLEAAFGLFLCGFFSLGMHGMLYPWKFVNEVRELDESLQAQKSKEAFGGLTELPHTETEMLPFLRKKLFEMVWHIRFLERNKPDSPEINKRRYDREKFLKACSCFGYRLGDQSFFFRLADKLLDQGKNTETINFLGMAIPEEPPSVK